MLYSISNKQYDVCFGSTNKQIDIGLSSLSVNNYLYKNNDIDIWSWTSIIAIDSSFIGSSNLYLKSSDSDDIVLIKQDINTNRAIVTQITGVCPTQTPTQTTTPTNTLTPTNTPTNTNTPSQTPTISPTSTVYLSRFLYYISSNLETLCYNRYDASVKAISVYDLDSVLQAGSFIYKNTTASTRWYYSEFISNLGIVFTPRIYLVESITGIVYSVIPGTSGFAIIESEQIPCPPMRISDSRYNLCHTNFYQTVEVNTTYLTRDSYLYKRDGVGKWTWSEIIGLDSAFPSLYTLYLKNNTSTTTIAIKEDISTGFVVISNVDTACPTQTPTPTITRTSTSTPTQTMTNTGTSSPTPTSTMTGTVTSTPTLTPTQTQTRTQSPTPTQTPSNSQTPSQTPTSSQTSTPSNTPTQSKTPTNTPTYSPTPTDPLNGSFYYLSDNSYNICHNNPSNLLIVYDQGVWLEVNDIVYQTSDASDWYTMSELATFLGLPSLSVAYIRPADIGAETYRIRQIEADNDGKASVVNIFQCVTPTPTSTITPTQTKTPTNTPTKTSTQTSTSTETPTSTVTATQTSTVTPTQTPTASQTPTPTQTNTPTLSQSQTPTQTVTSTRTPTSSTTPTITSTETPTNTPTQTPTITETPTSTPTPTITSTETITPTSTPSQTPTQTETPTETPTNTPTVTSTMTVTPTNTPTKTTTPTPSSTAVYIYEAINLNINNVITGNRYKVELISDDFGIAKPFPSEITFLGGYSPQRINFKLGFAANISSVIVSAKITDLDTGRIEYNSVFIKCNSILDCY